MDTLTFTVDAKLLRELGERLVGRPHMALAELIKNAYDADARNVVITFAGDSIIVVDDGHGMTEEEFRRRWMRIGTTEKNRQAVSPLLERTLTGSKGVGRLAVQLLARELELHSVAVLNPSRADLASRDLLPPERLGPEVDARIVWPKAILKRDLTDVAVDFDTYPASRTFANGSLCGTSVVLRGLVDTWTPAMFRRLAQEIWALQPPFAVEADSEQAFNVALHSPDDSVTETFERQMSAILDIATATISAQLLPPGSPTPNAQRFALPEASADGVANDGDVASTEDRSASGPARQLLVKVKVSGAKQARFVVDIPECQIATLDYEIRVFDLNNRQPSGVKVGTARDYLSRFGGVHIYDNGFRLPYYGPDQDWLRIEIDHAHRLSRSALLPEELQRKNAMQDLPNNNRLFGFANVSTSAEQRVAENSHRRVADALAIQVTRDRLVPNLAYDQLRRAVRVGVDLYALERARTKVRDSTIRRRKRADPTPALDRASDVVESLRPRVEPAAYQTLRDAIDVVIEDTDARRRDAIAYASLLGALATAGMTSLAYEHEISKQRAEIQRSARKLRTLASRADDDLAAELREQADNLDKWAVRAERIRSLFRPLLDEESRTEMARFSARKLVADVTEQISVLGRGAHVDIESVPVGIQLPLGGYASWSAVIQNLLTNAFRATQASKPRLIRIDAGLDGTKGWLRVQDNGDGVDLADSARLFDPFERGVGHDAHAEALGLGGSGLGLSIVRMMLDEIGATAQFVAPEPGWSTSVKIDWKEGR
jgi:signal transduction histidine kinase